MATLIFLISFGSYTFCNTCQSILTKMDDQIIGELRTIKEITKNGLHC